MVEFSLQPPSSSRRSGRYAAQTKPQPSSHIIGLSIMIQPVLKLGTHWESAINIKDVVPVSHHECQRHS